MDWPWPLLTGAMFGGLIAVALSYVKLRGRWRRVILSVSEAPAFGGDFVFIVGNGNVSHFAVHPGPLDDTQLPAYIAAMALAHNEYVMIRRLHFSDFMHDLKFTLSYLVVWWLGVLLVYISYPYWPF